MPYLSQFHYETDQNPASDHFSGRILEAGHPDARYTLVGEGSIFTDEEAATFGLIGYKGITKVGENDAGIVTLEDPSEAAKQ